MKKVLLIMVILACNLACQNRTDGQASEDGIAFDQAKWQTKLESDYPYREQMLADLLADDTLKKLKRNEVLTLLGEPDRIDSAYLFYRIAQKRVRLFPIHTKTLVIKFVDLADDSEVQKVMIHE